MRKFQLFIKRAFDLTVSIIMLIFMIIIPIMIVIPLLIKLTSKGPAVFTQDRVGKDGKIFKIYKFRTMLIPEESFAPDGRRLEPKERITKVGCFLRKTSLDELMQIFNVINGTMSFVGPRPTLPYQVENYNEYQKRRLIMRPGITGWAQVNGRNNLTWSEKIEYDIQYIDGFSMWFDIRILLKTIKVVLKHEGVPFTKEDKINTKHTADVQDSECVKIEK